MSIYVVCSMSHVDWCCLAPMQLSSSEKDATLEREQLLLDKIAELSNNIASLTGTNAGTISHWKALPSPS